MYISETLLLSDLAAISVAIRYAFLFVFLRAITLVEALICIKFGKDLFEQTIKINIIVWLALQVL